MKNKIRTIFIGTPDFAIPSLRALINDERFDVVVIVTQPDKKIGRKQVITPTPVKTFAEKNNTSVLQPKKILDIESEIIKLKPDLIVVIAYAQIIPESILNIPKHGVINIHGSLLPKYRGASCIQAAILNGDKKTGVTIMKMDKGLDTGPVLAQNEIDVLENDTTGTLYKKLSELGAEILTPTLKNYINGEIKFESQNNSLASYVGLLKKQDGKIDWNKTVIKIERFIRAMTPWPSAWTKINSKSLKILEVKNKSVKINKYKVGELFLDNNKLAIQCGENSLIIKKLQLEGKKEIKSQEFLKGHKNLIGQILK